MPIFMATLVERAQIDPANARSNTPICAMSGIYDSVEQLRDSLSELDRADELRRITTAHRPSTWRQAIDFDRPITTERKTLHKIPFIFVGGGRLTTIHAAKPQQVAEMIDLHHVMAGVDGAFFMMHNSESNQLVGPSLSRTVNNNQFHRGTAYEVKKSAGRPLVLMNPDTVKFIPFDPQRHNTLAGMQSELPTVTDAFIAAGWLVQKGQPQTLASFGNLYKANEPRYRAFWGFDRQGKPILGISTKNISAVELGEVLAQEGWQEAVMVDSGQSTSLAYQGKSLVPGYVPRPVPHAIGLLPPNPNQSGNNTCQPFTPKLADRNN
jgi:poly-beta-1,6-N-acetyl-D-glucosamine N-deacetylase